MYFVLGMSVRTYLYLNFFLSKLDKAGMKAYNLPVDGEEKQNREVGKDNQIG